MELTQDGKNYRAEYYREYYKKNRERIKARNRAYWNRKAEERKQAETDENIR